MKRLRNCVFALFLVSCASCQFYGAPSFQQFFHQSSANYQQLYQQPSNYQQFNQHAVQVQSFFQPCQHVSPFGFPFGYTNPCPMYIKREPLNNHHGKLMTEPSEKLSTFGIVPLMNPSPTRKASHEESTTRQSHVVVKTETRSKSVPGEISASKCEEYTDLSQEVVAFGGMSVVSTMTEHKSSICALTTGLIVGGVKANPEEFPHLGAIAYESAEEGIVFGCGASLISERFMLTAAHCKFLGPNKAKFVRLGVTNLRATEAIDYMVDEFIRHEKYAQFTGENDIAVMKLSRDVSLNDPKNIRPACLWQTEHFPQNQTVASGWGQTSNRLKSVSSELMKVNLDLLDESFCIHTYEDMGAVINQNHICAGNLAGGKDTCQGDSGGPIQIVLDDHRCVSHVIGVTSFGGVCAQEESPSVYTRVSAYIEWIESHVWKQH